MGYFDDLLKDEPVAATPKRRGYFDDLLEEEDAIPSAQPKPTKLAPWDTFQPKPKEVGTLEGIANAARNAFDSSRQAMDVVGGVTPEEAKNISKIEYDKQSRKLAQGYDEYQKAEGMDAVWAFAKNPIEVTSNIIAEGLSGSLPALGAGLAAGGAGALIGAPTGIGAPIGFTAGQIAGTFAGSLATEYGGKILEEMQNEGMDIQDPDSIQKFFSNQTLVDAAKDKALKRGVPIAAFDAISAGIGGKLGRVIGKQFLTKTGEAAAELGVQAALGGGGEVAGALAAGEPIEGKAVFGEIIGEAGPGAAEIITGRMADRAARVKAEEDAKIKSAAELSTNLEENSAPLTAAAVKSTTATTIEQDKLAAQLEEQLDAEELVAVKEPTAAPPAIKSKEEFAAIYSQVAPEELTRAEQSFTNELATAITEEARANAQNALEAIKEVKATVTPPAPTVEPTITPEVTPAVATAQPTETYATEEIIKPEGVRPELETGTQIEAEEAGVSRGLQPPARGEEEGQVIFGLRSVADNTATREQISALSEAGLVDIVKGKPVINEDGAAILAQAEVPAIVEQEPVTTPAPEEAVTPAPTIAEEADIEAGAPPLGTDNLYFENNLAQRAWRLTAGFKYDKEKGDWFHPDYPNTPRAIAEQEITEANPPNADSVRNTLQQLKVKYGVAEPQATATSEPQAVETAQPEPTTFAKGDLVRIPNRVPVYKNGQLVGGRTEMVGASVIQTMPDGKVEVRLQQGGYATLAPNEIESVRKAQPTPAPVTEQAAPAEAPAITPAPVVETPAVTEAPAAEVAPTSWIAPEQKLTPQESRALQVANLRGTEKRTGNITFVPEKLMTPQRLQSLRTEQESSGTLKRFPKGGKFIEIKMMGDVTGDPYAKGWAIIDRRPDLNRREWIAQIPSRDERILAGSIANNESEKIVSAIKEGSITQERSNQLVDEAANNQIISSDFANNLKTAISNSTPAVSETITPAAEVAPAIEPLTDDQAETIRDVITLRKSQGREPNPEQVKRLAEYDARKAGVDVQEGDIISNIVVGHPMFEAPQPELSNLVPIKVQNKEQLVSPIQRTQQVRDAAQSYIGQYQVEQAKAKTPAQKKAFAKKFNKSELDRQRDILDYIKNDVMPELDRLEKTAPSATPAVSETITEPAAVPTQPEGIAVGNRIKLGKSPQTYTIEEVIPQTANDKKFGEQYYNVKNEKTGETQVVEKNDMKPVSSRRRKMASERYSIWEYPEQDIPSAATSINASKLPETFKRVEFKSGTINADIGGGRFDNATEALASKGVENIIYDPFNRSIEWNKNSASRISGGQADTATVNSVLNVIKEPKNRERVIMQAADAVKKDGKAYFLIYEGDASGNSRITKQKDGVALSWQEHRKAETYIAEINKFFGKVEKSGNLLIASDPISSQEIRKMASEPDPLPENERYGQVKLNRRIQKYFGGKIPDKVYVVDNTDNKEYQYKAAYYPDLGILVVNNAYVRKGENVGDIIAHELGHYAFGDKKFKDAFDNFYNSLSPEDKAKIDNIIEDSYNEETEESQIEERNVIAFTAYTIVNPQRRSLWNAVLDALKAFANKVFGKNFQMSDPNRTALAMLATAKKRFAAGEEIVREDTKAKRAAAQTQDARFAELEARAKAGDKEAEAEAQRMVDEAAKEAGYDVGPVWHGSPDFVGNEFDLNMRGRRGFSRGGFSFTREKRFAEAYMQSGVDPSQKLVDEINSLMRELQKRINSGFEWVGPYNEVVPPEFKADAVDDISDVQGYIDEISSTLPSDLQVVSSELATRPSPENFNPNPRLIRAFLKEPKIIDVSGKELLLAEYPSQIKSADPFTYDDAGNLIPLSERFQPTTPDIRRMAVEAEPRREQVAGRTDRGTDIITTPVGIIKQTNEVLRKNFFDGTTVSDEATKKAWEYIERSLDIESGKATELAGQINNVVDAETNSKARMGASLFHVSLANYAAKLAALGDSTMLSFLVRRINRMPLDNRPGDLSQYARGLRGAQEYDIDGYGALKVEQQAKRDRTAAEIFARGNPTEQQVKDVSDAIDAADNATIGTPEEVASDVEQIEKRTKRNITKKLETLLKKGSLKEMIASIKNTPLEEQQAPGWIEKVIKAYLEKAGLTGDAATTAAKLYDSILTERFVAAKQKAFEETLKRSAPWNNYLSRNSRMAKDSLKKIQVAIRTGVLDPSQTIESVIAKENGWDGFTKEQFEKIVQLDNIINNPDNDDVTRREAMSELNKVIVDAKLPVRFKDALGAYYVGNALMGIPTGLVNLVSPAGFAIRNMMTDIGRYAFTDPARIPIAFESFLDSMRSWYDQTSYAFKNQIYLNDVVEYLQGQNVLRELFDKGKKQWANGEYAAGFVNMAVGMTQITGRVLSSLDQGAIAMLENQNITRYAMEALAGNTKGKIPKDKLKEFANMVLHTKRRVIAESVASGMPRDRAGVLADLAVKSEIIAALATTKMGPASVLDAAINDALLSVGRNKAITIKGAEQERKNLRDEGIISFYPIGILEGISEYAGRQGSGMQIFAKMLYGFALVPARVFHNVAWFSPYGFVRLWVDNMKKNKGQDSPYAMSLQTDVQYKQRLTEAIAGSIVMLGLFALRAGSSDDEDDKQFKIVITGNGPSATTDRQYYDSWNKKWKPYSIHIVIGDTIIPINIGRGGEALFFPIMLAGAMDDWEIKKKQNDTKKSPEDLNMMASMLGSSFFALLQRGPYAAFTKQLVDASKDGRVTEELASQVGYFGKTFVPLLGTSVARNITDFINDPVDRSSVEGAIYANTPIVGPWMGAKALNALGQPVRADDWGDKLFKLGVPVVFSFPKNTPMNELNEIILKQGSGPTFPTRTNAQKRFGDILTDKEFETYVREYGKVMSDRMFKNRTKLARMKPSDYDDELEKYARGYSAGDFKVKGASDMAVQAVKRMRQ